MTGAPAAAPRDEGERYGRAALIGTGYIGGSLALALTHAGRVGTWVGTDADGEHLRRARLLGIVGATAPTPAAAAAGADLIVIAVPVLSGPAVIRAIASAVRPDALIVDVGSTKQSITAAAVAALADPGRFVGCHPIAGLERTGPEVTDVNLFHGRYAILTPVAETAPAAIEAAAELWRAAGARLTQMDPVHHDEVMAAVSHLPHVVAYSLIRTLAGLGGEVGRDLVGMSGAGLRDTTRIASSSPEMWRSIFLDNREHVLGMIEAFAARLDELRRLVSTGNGAELLRLLAEARAARERILEQP
ncbi:MAG TPA: prephenate dehydrogenase/arogenate dehydrogenase family protein [Polyangia bacterium]